MQNSEYNYFEETKKINENKNYEFIQNSLYNKESYSIKKEVIETNEYGHSKKKESKKNTNNQPTNLTKKLLEKITQTSSSLIQGFAASVAVAVTSIVVLSNIFIKSPNIELLDLNVGYDYVKYDVYIDEMNESLDYYSIISNNFEKYSYELEEGKNSNTVFDLMHNMQYDFYVVGLNNENKEENVYFKKTFYTTVEQKSVKVKWIVEDNVVKEIEIDNKEEPIYDGEIPIKESDDLYDYIFDTWDKSVDQDGNIIYKALFKKIEYKYSATFDKLDIKNIIINYDEKDYYKLIFNTNFDNDLDSRLLYRIILKDAVTNETYEYEGTDVVAAIKVPISINSLYVTYESVGIFNNKEKIFESYTLEEVLQFSNININIDDNLTLISTDKYQLKLDVNSDFESEEIYELLTVLITYDDNTTYEIILDDIKINESMYIDIPVQAYCSSFIVEYNLNLLGINGHNERIIEGQKEFKLDSTFELERVYVDSKQNMMTRFLFKYHLVDENHKIIVEDVDKSNIILKDEFVNYIELELDSTLNQQEFKYYILNEENNNLISQEFSKVIDILDITGEYSFDYVNPGEAIVTFNEDNTMNIYLNTFFETEDEDIWYLVRYTNFEDNTIYDIKYNESIAYIENIPINNYGIEYFVYKTVNQIDYELAKYIVSGGVEINNQSIISGELIDNGDGNLNLYLSFFEYKIANFESVILFVDEEKLIINKEDFILNENIYEYNYTLNKKPNELIIEYEALFNNQDIYEIVSSNIEIKGNQYKKIYLNLLEQ